MVKSYLKYEHAKSFGLVTSSSSNIVWAPQERSGTGAGRAIVAANEEVLCWDIKKGELLSRWRDENCRAQVTAIAQSKTDKDVFAVGYEDGSIRIWDSKITTTIVNFNGHKSAITILAFDKTGVRLASGSKDTDVIVWDLVAEVGQYKLRGHKDQVTGLHFVELEPQPQDEEAEQAMVLDGETLGDGYLLTTGKDSLIKIWDLSSRHCVETHVAQTNGECWALGVSPDFSGCVTAGNDGELKVCSDDKMLASAANGSLKIWNVKTQTCIRTFECGYALCCAFLPGDKVVVVGTKTGELELFDVASAALLDSVSAHEGAIWSLQVHPDGRSVVTGSADKTAKFWDFKIVQEPVLGTTRTTPKLKLVQARILKVSDDILSLRFSPDARLLAVALLDNTVKVFFTDSLKLYLNLYGHKLPVLSMDISYDSKLIVTSSADKNVRIWGLDFGDCHKALFAHQDSILQVAFVPHNTDGNGHHFFSSSKDRSIKYWDADKFEQIQRIDGHHGEIWALAVGHSGTFLVSASHDKSIRVWEETDEQIFLEEEREKEIEELYESTLTTSLEQDPDAEDQNGEVTAASKQTVETLMAGERITEALELGMADLNVVKEWEEAKSNNPNIAPPQRNPIFMALGGISAETHVMNVLQRIKAAALHDALLVLPFATVPMLFTFLNIFAIRSMNIPLTCRILFFMLKTHHRQIVASKTMRAMLDGIRMNLRNALKRQKDEMGYNIAALKVVGLQIKEKSVKDYVDENWEEEDQSRSVKKRAHLPRFNSANANALQAPIPEKIRNIDLVVYEKNEGIGGVWWLNKYPGLACDIPSHSYQYTFAPNPYWSSLYAPGREIQKYLQDVAEKYGATRFIKTQHKVEKCVWDADDKQWHITVQNTSTGETFEESANIVIAARGQLNEVNWPQLPGLDKFQGKLLHSAEWDESYDFRHKKVGVIGNGSSAIQIVPSLQKLEGISMTTFMRSPTWISAAFGDAAMVALGLDPNDIIFTKEKQEALARDPDAYFKMRKVIEDGGNLIHDSTIRGTKMQKAFTDEFRTSMREKLAKKPELLNSIVPDFAPGCRRLTPGKGYLEALTEDNVEVVNDPIVEITESGVKLASGREIQLDAIACATGFKISAPPNFEVRGKNGQTLAERWTPHPESYLSIAVDGFPNYLMMFGPNSAIGFGSLTKILEQECDYVVKIIRKMQKEEYATIEPKSERVADFSQYIGEYFKNTVVSMDTK
ncbi:putative wd domain-containing protein [Phaeoacremonium minimum UCRPA7]|uniref:Putative wd domain-containing protein n=1 Tax=Phaeoacremonium minimum (strain UCR-PA7) TaxID=1286976 RepID=R8BES6_PHAM7|nr:putative wd domain-containing protein [Phaeoacremonium minimum UCRPA7]EON97799.1 putative wd domain-containing protein [Phaeoacremonium minimum UCRPA7]